MGVFDKMKDWVGIDDEYEDEDYEEEFVEVEKPVIERKSLETRNNLSVPRRDNKVVNMQKGSSISGAHSFKLVVLEPSGFEETPKLVDNLKTRKPVIVNLEKLESETARKIFDFLSGATYALNGNVQKVSTNIFIFAPENVDINSDTEHKGFDFQGEGLWNK